MLRNSGTVKGITIEKPFFDTQHLPMFPIPLTEKAPASEKIVRRNNSHYHTHAHGIESNRQKERITHPAFPNPQSHSHAKSNQTGPNHPTPNHARTPLKQLASRRAGPPVACCTRKCDYSSSPDAARRACGGAAAPRAARRRCASAVSVACRRRGTAYRSARVVSFCGRGLLRLRGGCFRGRGVFSLLLGDFLLCSFDGSFGLRLG